MIVIDAADYLAGSHSAGINEAIDALGRSIVRPKGHVLRLPPGVHEITETLDFGGAHVSKSQYGIVVQGAGCGGMYVDPETRDPKPSGGTVLRWAGETGQPMMRVMGVRYARFASFVLDGAGRAGVGLDYRGNNETSAVSTDNVFDQISIYHCMVGIRVAGEPIAFQQQGGGDQVDHSTFHSVKVAGCRVGLWHHSSQAVGHLFLRCKFSRFSSVGTMVMAGMPCFTTCYWGGHGTSGTGLYLGPEANIVVCDGLGHWELPSGVAAIRGDARGPESMLRFTGQNLLKMDPADPTPLCDYSRPGILQVDGCRFDRGGPRNSSPALWRVRDPARLAWGANTEKLQITKEVD